MSHRKIERAYPTESSLYALCTDGSLWVYRAQRWMPYPLIPGDDLTMRPVLPEGPMESGDVFGHTVVNPDIGGEYGNGH